MAEGEGAVAMVALFSWWNWPSAIIGAALSLAAALIFALLTGDFYFNDNDRNDKDQ